MATKIIYDGDTLHCQTLRKFALSQLDILHNLMDFRGLSVGRREVRLLDGSVVECLSYNQDDIIKIYCPVSIKKPLIEQPEELHEIGLPLFIQDKLIPLEEGYGPLQEWQGRIIWFSGDSTKEDWGPTGLTRDNAKRLKIEYLYPALYSGQASFYVNDILITDRVWTWKTWGETTGIPVTWKFVGYGNPGPVMNGENTTDDWIKTYRSRFRITFNPKNGAEFYYIFDPVSFGRVNNESLHLFQVGDFYICSGQVIPSHIGPSSSAASYIVLTAPYPEQEICDEMGGTTGTYTREDVSITVWANIDRRQWKIYGKTGGQQVVSMRDDAYEVGERWAAILPGECWCPGLHYIGRGMWPPFPYAHSTLFSRDCRNHPRYITEYPNKVYVCLELHSSIIWEYDENLAENVCGGRYDNNYYPWTLTTVPTENHVTIGDTPIPFDDIIFYFDPFQDDLLKEILKEEKWDKTKFPCVIDYSNITIPPSIGGACPG